jgi:hypothetical protein
MNTASPRIPSPFDTAGIFAGFSVHSDLSGANELASVSFSDCPCVEIQMFR